MLQGEAGYSIKDREGRTASYYYSLPDLAASGTVRIEREEFEVHGRVWMDREWSTAVLAKGQAGWDWFALRPGDGAILMLFQVREQAGEGFRYAMYRSPGGEVSRFHGRDITMRPLRSWVSAQMAGADPEDRR